MTDLFCSQCGTPQRRPNGPGVGVCRTCLAAVMVEQPTDVFAMRVSDLTLPNHILAQVEKARSVYRVQQRNNA